MAKEQDTTADNDEVYERLYKYDFQGNEKFKEGWKKICKSAKQSQLDELLMKVQVFFYAREIENAEVSGYRQWLKKKDLKVPDFFTLIDTDTVDKGKPPLTEEEEKKNEVDPCVRNQTQTANTTSQLSENNNSRSNCSIINKTKSISLPCSKLGKDNSSTPVNVRDSTEEITSRADHTDLQGEQIKGDYPASFSELIQMLQSGMRLLGIDDVIVEPTNETPSQSVLERKKKPWESGHVPNSMEH